MFKGKHVFWRKIVFFMTNWWCSLHGKEYVCQISCKYNNFSRNYAGGGG